MILHLLQKELVHRYSYHQTERIIRERTMNKRKYRFGFLESGVVHQDLLEELSSLRQEQIWFVLQNGTVRYKVAYEKWDMEVRFQKDKPCRSVILNDELSLVWENGIFTMLYAGDGYCGREERQIIVEELEDIRILKDVSMLEVYLNHGEFVLTTRYFPEVTKWTPIKIQGAQDAKVWDMKNMEVKFCGSDEA